MRWFWAFVLAILILVPLPAVACPNCKDAVANSGEDDDPLREARAYNRSIYLMVGVPYLLVGGGGLIGYRKYRMAQKLVVREQDRS